MTERCPRRWRYGRGRGLFPAPPEAVLGAGRWEWGSVMIDGAVGAVLRSVRRYHRRYNAAPQHVLCSRRTLEQIGDGCGMIIHCADYGADYGTDYDDAVIYVY